MMNLDRQRGVSLLVAVIITGALLLLATAISDLAVKGSELSSENRESQYAFYAADSGIECALYWDVKNPTGVSAFSTTTSTVITCNKDASNSSNQFVVGGNSNGVSRFTISYLPDPYCAIVNVTKNADNTTLIQSYGYNNCSGSGITVQRALQVTY